MSIRMALSYGRLAQLARASRLHREGQEFESLTAYHISPMFDHWGFFSLLFKKFLHRV